MKMSTPHLSTFTYAAWSIQPRLLGPLVLPSARRRTMAGRIAAIGRALVSDGEVEWVRTMRASSIPPLPGRPKFDLAFLIRGGSDAAALITHRLDAVGVPHPQVLTQALNVARFGDTDAGRGTILLNHFAGAGDTDTAIEVWNQIADWYSSALGVDNSTLLRFEDQERFLMMNYAVIPGSAGAFMAGQLLRPSFHSQVRPRLRAAGIRPFPVFLRDTAV